MYGTVKSEALVMYFYHIRKGDNVKIFMQLMDLKSYKKVEKSKKDLVVSFYRTVLRANS